MLFFHFSHSSKAISYKMKNETHYQTLQRPFHKTLLDCANARHGQVRYTKRGASRTHGSRTLPSVFCFLSRLFKRPSKQTLERSRNRSAHRRQFEDVARILPGSYDRRIRQPSQVLEHDERHRQCQSRHYEYSISP